MVVASDLDYPPLSSLENGEIQGFDAEMLKLLEEELQTPVHHVLDTWPEVLRGLEAEQYHAVSGILHTQERAERFDFTIPYIIDHYAIFAHRPSGITGPGDLPGKQAAILREDAAVNSYLIPHGLDDSLVLTETFTEAMEMVNRGEADYTIAPYSLGRVAQEEMDSDQIAALGRELFRVEYRMAVPKGKRERLYRLNNGLAELMSEGKLQQLRRHWAFHSTFDVSTIPAPTKAYLYLICLVAGLLLGLGGLALARKLRERRNPPRPGEEILKEALDSLPFEFWIKDREGAYLWANRQHAEKEEPLGAPPEEPAAVREQDEGVLQEGRPSSRYQGETGIYQVPLYRGRLHPQGLAGYTTDAAEVLRLQKTVRKLYQQLADKENRIQELATVDRETGLYNREYLDARIDEHIQRYVRAETPFCLLRISLPPRGQASSAVPEDQIYAYLGELLRKTLRSGDIPGRSGEKAFLIILPGTSREEGESIILSLLEHFSQTGISISRDHLRLTEYRGQGRASLLQEVSSGGLT